MVKGKSAYLGLMVRFLSPAINSFPSALLLMRSGLGSERLEMS